MADWLAADEAARRDGFDAYCRAYFTKDGEPNAKGANKWVLDAHPEIESTITRETDRLQTALENIETRFRVLTAARALATLASRMRDAWPPARKAAQAVLDYDDLIAQAIDVMRRPDIGPWVLQTGRRHRPYFAG